MQRFKNILFVVEPEVDNSAALARAIALAEENQAALALIEIVEGIPGDMQMAIVALTPAELLQSIVAEKRRQLTDMVNTASVSRELDCAVNIRVGRPFLEIIREVLSNDHDLVIKSAARRPAAIRLYGSTDMHLLRKCPCPVWIVKPGEQSPYRRILAAVDRDSADSTAVALNRYILEIAMSLALAEFSELHVVHAWRPIHENFLKSPRTGFSDAEVDAMIEKQRTGRQQGLEQMINTVGGPKNAQAIDYLKPQLHLKKGEPRDEVPRIARELNVELIVMGTVGRVGVPGFFMGNTAEEILEQIECSVLAIKPPGFVSPVSVN